MLSKKEQKNNSFWISLRFSSKMDLINHMDQPEGPFEWNDAGYESGYYSNDDDVENN